MPVFAENVQSCAGNLDRPCAEVCQDHQQRSKQLLQPRDCGEGFDALSDLIGPKCHWGTFARPSAGFFLSVLAVDRATAIDDVDSRCYVLCSDNLAVLKEEPNLLIAGVSAV